MGPPGPPGGFGMGVGRKSSAHPLRLNTNSRVHICKHVWKYVYRTGEYLYSRQGHSAFTRDAYELFRGTSEDFCGLACTCGNVSVNNG